MMKDVIVGSIVFVTAVTLVTFCVLLVKELRKPIHPVCETYVPLVVGKAVVPICTRWKQR